MMLLLVSVFLLAVPSTMPATNGLCPTCPMKVNDKSPKVAVRGRDYRTCFTSCSADLEKNPDNYLEKDRTSKSAKKR